MVSLRKFVYSLVPQPRSSEDSHGSEETLLEENKEKGLKFDSLPQHEIPFDADEGVKRRRVDLWRFLQYTHIVLTLVLIFVAIQGDVKVNRLSRMNPQLTYSPAQDVVRYVTKKFTSSLDYGKTIYQGPPGEKSNEAWKALFIHGLTRISAEEAAPMQNKTLPIPDDPDHYITSLAVFHQLHCLNAIRFAIWNRTMDEHNEKAHHETSMRHLDHCVDMIRQALMCAADISPFVWARDPRDGKAKGLSDITHTCRDWDAIAQWAADRPFRTGFDVHRAIDNDPLGWGGLHYVMDYGEITDWEAQKPDYEAWAQARTHEQHLRGHAGYDDRTNYP